MDEHNGRRGKAEQIGGQNVREMMLIWKTNQKRLRLAMIGVVMRMSLMSRNLNQISRKTMKTKTMI